MSWQPDQITPPGGVMLGSNAVRFALRATTARSVDSPWAAIDYPATARWSACYPFNTPELAHD